MVVRLPDKSEPLGGTKMSMIRWMCGFTLKERKKSAELLVVEPVDFAIRKCWSRWIGHVECKDDGDCIKR